MFYLSTQGDSVKQQLSTMDILLKLSAVVHTETREQTYITLIQMLADRFMCDEVMFCAVTEQKKVTYSKFFVCWNNRKKSLQHNDQFIDVTKIHLGFTKFKSEQKQHTLLLSQNKHQAIFYSNLYCFAFKMPQEILPTQQALLEQFLECIIVVLSVCFQLAQLTKNVISYEEENDLLRGMVSQGNLERSALKYSYSDITGESKAFLKLLRYLDQVIEHSDRHDLLYIQGESGTGKSLLARAIHRYSNRRDKNFVEVNCGAIVDNLCEAEFFGIAPKSGIANVSKDGKPGLFELADGGILFLDEVSELSLTMQASLLTVIEGKPFRRVCGQENIVVDVRIISASIHDIKTMPATQFLPELAQRLDGIRIQVPPLRERKQDINQLVDYFCKQLSPQRQKNITPQIRRLFKRYDWPGNIRELSNSVRRCSIGGDLPPHFEQLQHPEDIGEMKSFEDLLKIEKRAIIKNRVLFMVERKPNCTLEDVAESFGLKRDALRRRLYEVGYTWEKLKQLCQDEL